MEERIRIMLPLLDERQRRIFLAAEAKAYGRGGIAAVSRLSGAAPSTIRKGLKEIGCGELIERQDVLRACCPADEKAWDCLGKGSLEPLAAQAEAQRRWHKVWMIDTFLYAQTEGEQRSYFREVWVGEWKTE